MEKTISSNLRAKIRKDKNFTIIPFNRRPIKESYLVSNVLGGWDFLNEEEFRAFNSFNLDRDSSLFTRLHERGLVADERNIESLIEGYRTLNAHLFSDTSLHIAVVTTRCNLQCTYCQSKSPQRKDMDIEVAARVLKYLFEVRTTAVTLELQGGEPLLNWETVKFLVEHARKFNKSKNLQLALVSNCVLLDEVKMKFLADFNVSLCCSLDGPRQLHDAYRRFPNGEGSYTQAVKNIKFFEEKFGRKVGLLPTITKHSFGYFKEIVDEHLRWKQPDIALRPVNQIGGACTYWPALGYSAEEFIVFYKNSMDYILELNKKGIFIRERMAAFMLKKILSREDPGFVELMNPCGAGRGQIVYMPDGSCYPCDEARMVEDELFCLGNILKEDYDILMRKDNLLHLLESSVMNLWDYNSAFFPWTGTCPVVNYYTQKNFVPKIACSPLHKVYNFQFQYIFEKMLEDKDNMNIFKRWVKKEVDHA
ncbi:MAG: His-Xaa-Ser system radical SAM maturase HxsB [Candidatus Omnitrophota bacterium]